MWKKIKNWCILVFANLMIRISIAMYNTEILIIKADVFNLFDKNKHNQRMRHRNKLLEKFYAGHRDEKYTKDFYEVLKKADKFMRDVTPEKAEMVAAKHGMTTLGKKDKWGRRYDHFGFFDPSSKNYGKTMGEVIEEEIKQRGTTDDPFPIEIMFDNTPIIKGIGETKIKDLGGEVYESLNSLEKALTARFPMTVIHKEKNPANKIEQLTKYLHIKNIDHKERILEFFIPAKFKVFDLSEKNDIFKEIINIDQVWIRDEYGTRYGFKIKEYRKRIEYAGAMVEKDENIEYHVIKFNGTKIENI